MNFFNAVQTQLDLPQSQQHILENPNLKTPEGRELAIEAAQYLQQALNSNINPALQRLVSVRDQMKRFEKWKQKFLGPVSRHLNNLFIHLSNEVGDIPLSTTDVVLSKNHLSIHQELKPYTELMHWIKAMDSKTYDGLTAVYTKSLSKIYERDIRNFFTLVGIEVNFVVNYYNYIIAGQTTNLRKITRFTRGLRCFYDIHF